MASVSVKVLLFWLLIAFLYPQAVHGATFRSSANQTTLIELFSSEGCSSCPPADKWISSLQHHPGLWKEFVPAAYHVTYWDYLGWKDRFADPKYDDLQRRYARDWGSASAYTPGLVLNGKDWRGWRRNQPQLGTGAKAPGVLSLKSGQGSAYTVEFEPFEKTPTQWEVQVVLLGFALSTDVRSGENRGRKLRHDFVVLQWTKRLLVWDHDRYQVDVVLIPSIKEKSVRYGISAWITRHNETTPLQAVGGYLN